MKKIIVLFMVLASSVFFTGCTFNKDAVVKVNNDIITKQQVDEAFDNFLQITPSVNLNADIKNNPDSYENLMIREKIVNDLIIKKLLEQEMKAKHIKATQEDMDKQYNILVGKVGSKEKFEELLKENKISQKQFKKELKELVQMQKLIDTLGFVKITDKDALNYYKKNINEFKHPDKVRASHILIMADPMQIAGAIMSDKKNKDLKQEDIEKMVQKEMDAKKQKAEDLLKQLKKDPSQFAKLAKENSDDTMSAQEGGDLGFFEKEVMVEEFSKVAFAQKPNTISDVVKSPYGYHIIMVTDRMKAGIEPFEKVKDSLKNYLEQQEKIKLIQNHIDTIKASATIKFINKDYDPKEIDKKIKEAQEKNPSLIGSQSAAE